MTAWTGWIASVRRGSAPESAQNIDRDGCLRCQEGRPFGQHCRRIRLGTHRNTAESATPLRFKINLVARTYSVPFSLAGFFTLRRGRIISIGGRIARPRTPMGLGHSPAEWPHRISICSGVSDGRLRDKCRH